MTEGLTKWVEARATREASARESVKFLEEQIICRFGAPLVVVTDNGSHFKGAFSEICKRLGVFHRYVTPYHPQTTGQDERVNALLLGRIRKWRKDGHKKWDEDLPLCVLACNTRKASPITFSPIEALMGFTVTTASTLHLGDISKKEIRRRVAYLTGILTHRTTLVQRLLVLESLRDEAIRVKDEKARKMKERYDRKTHQTQFEEGERVLLYDMSLLKQWSRKLEERWNGPFTVVWKGTMGGYNIDLGDGKTKMVSGDHLKRYFPRL